MQPTGRNAQRLLRRKDKRETSGQRHLFERVARREQLRTAAAAGPSVLAFHSLAGELLAGVPSREGETRDGMGSRRHDADIYWTDDNVDFTAEFFHLCRPRQSD